MAGIRSTASRRFAYEETRERGGPFISRQNTTSWKFFFSQHALYSASTGNQIETHLSPDFGEKIRSRFVSVTFLTSPLSSSFARVKRKNSLS